MRQGTNRVSRRVALEALEARINPWAGSDTILAALPVLPEGDNLWAASGTIEKSNESDWFAWTAPAGVNTAVLTVTRDVIGNLDSTMQIRDSRGNPLFFHGPYGDETNSVYAFDNQAVMDCSVISGENYFFSIQGNSQGVCYRLNIQGISDDFGASTASIVPLDRTPSDQMVWSKAGSIGFANDSDWFPWVAPAGSGFVQAIVMPAAGSGLVPQVRLLDCFGGTLSTGYGSSSSGMASTSYSVVPGAVYFVAVSKNYSSSASTGSYSIALTAFAPDEYGASVATASPLLKSDGLRWTANGVIQGAGDRDWFSWTAPEATAAVNIVVSRSGDGGVNPYLQLRDSSGNYLSSANSDSSGRASLGYSVTAGATYYLDVQGAYSYSSPSAGRYTVDLRGVVDDHGSGVSTADPLMLSGENAWIGTGTIDFGGDNDWFSWTAPADVKIITLSVKSNSIDSLQVLDSKGNWLTGAYTDETGNLCIDYGVKPKVKYYFNLVGKNIVCNYEFKLQSANFSLADDHGGMPSEATPLLAALDGTWSGSGSIDYAIDSDWFSWTAPANVDQIEIELTNLTDERPSPLLFLRSSDGIWQNYSYGDGTGVTNLIASVIPGNLYYIDIQNYDNLKPATVRYQLKLAEIVDDHGSTTGTATPIASENVFTWLGSGAIDFSGDSDWFSWTAPAGISAIQVMINQTEESSLNPYVQLRDSSANFLTSASSESGGNTVLNWSVTPGLTYYLDLQGSSYPSPENETGGYTVQLIGVADDHGSSVSAADALAGNGDNTWTGSGAVDFSGDRDWFSWTAPSGINTVQVRVDQSGSGMLQPVITIRDSSGQSLASQNSYSSSATLVYSVSPGDRYYLDVSGQSYGSGQKGGYALSLLAVTDDHGASIDKAFPLPVNGAGPLVTSGSIELSADSDWFSWRAPEGVSLAQVTFESSADTTMYPVLRLRDSQGFEIASVNGYSRAVDLRAPVLSGNIYFIDVSTSSYYQKTGGYTVSCRGYADDHGFSAFTAAGLTTTENGSSSASGLINYPQDTDWFLWTAPAQVASFRVELSGEDVVARLYDGGGNRLPAGGSEGSRVLESSVLGGVTYRIEVRATGSVAPKPYKLNLFPILDDAGSTPGNARPMTRSPDGWSADGSLDFTGDSDWFSWVAPEGGGSMVTTATGLVGGLPQPGLRIRDAKGALISAAFADANGVASTGFRAVGGASYLIDVRSMDPIRFGAYSVSLVALSPAEVSGLENATIMDTGAQGLGLEGAISVPGESDWFRWTVPSKAETGQAANGFRVRLSTVGDSGLAPRVWIRNSNGQYLGQGFSVPGGIAFAERAAKPGETYYFEARGDGDSSGNQIGRYAIRVDAVSDFQAAPAEGATDAVGDSVLTAGSLPRVDTPVIRGTIDFSGDRDWYQWIPTEDGYYSIDLRKDGSNLDTYLTVWDSTGKNSLGSDDDSGGNRNSRVYFQAEAGKSYFLEAKGYSTSSGQYYLQVTRDVGESKRDHGSLPENAPLMVRGQINQAGDKDWYQWTPALSGKYLVFLGKDGSSLDSFLTVLDSSLNILTSDDESGGDSDSLLVYQFSAGATYYIEAKSYYSYQIGDYILKISPVESDLGTDSEGADAPNAVPLVSLASGGYSSAGAIQSSIDTDWFVLAAPSGVNTLAVTISRGNTSLLNPAIEIRDDSGSRVAQSDSYAGSASVSYAGAVPGQKYYLVVKAGEAYGGYLSSGTYTLSARTFQDQGATASTAGKLDSALLGSKVSGVGEIQFSGDIDWYEWLAPQGANTVTVSVSPDAGSAVDLRVRLLDSNGLEVSNNYGTTVRSAVDPGKKYYVEIKSSYSGNGPLGQYTLTVTGISDQPDGVSTRETLLQGPAGWASTGSIQFDGDSDWFRWTAPADVTAIRVVVNPRGTQDQDFSSVYVTLNDGNGNYVCSGNSVSDKSGQFFSTAVEPGKTYFISVGNSWYGSGFRGDFSINLEKVADDSTPTASVPLTLGADTSSYRAIGYIQFTGDQDWFDWRAPAGVDAVRLRLESTDGSGETSYWNVALLEAGKELDSAHADLPGVATLDTRIQPGESYKIRVDMGDWRSIETAVRYTVTMVPIQDDLPAVPPPLSGPLPAGAPEISVHAEFRGVHQFNGDIDGFRWVVPQGIRLARVVVDAAVEGFTPEIRLVGGSLLANTLEGTLASALFQVEPGTGCVVSVGGTGNSSSYGLIIDASPDERDFLPVPAEAVSGIWSLKGKFSTPGDKDSFTWTAPEGTGFIQVNLQTVSSKDVPLTIIASTESGTPLAYSCRDGLNGASLGLAVKAGTRYSFEVSTPITASRDPSKLSYNFTIVSRPDDIPCVPALAADIPTSGAGMMGNIDFPGDSDWFRWTAPANYEGAWVVLKPQGVQDRAPCARLVIRNAAGIAIDSFDPSNNGECVAGFPASAGAIYYIEARGNAAGTGRYSVSIDATRDATRATAAEATVLADAGAGVWKSGGDIDYPGDKDWYSWIAPGGVDAIQTAKLTLRPEESATAISPIFQQQWSVSLLDEFGRPGPQLVPAGMAGSYTFRPLAGNTYHFEITAAGDTRMTIGRFVLQLGRQEDDQPPAESAVKSVTVAQTGADQLDEATGTINYSGDTDGFLLAIPAAGGGPAGLTKAVEVTVTAIGFTPDLSILDRSTGLAVSSHAVWINPEKTIAKISFNPVDGKTYALEVGSQGMPAASATYNIKAQLYQDSERPDSPSVPFAGALDVPSDADAFTWKAPSGGGLFKAELVWAGQGPAPDLKVVQDGNDRSDGKTARFKVIGGENLRLEIASMGGSSVGSYRIEISPVTDDAGNNPATAKELKGEGVIDYPGDRDFFLWKAPAEYDSVVITMGSVAGGIRSPSMMVYLRDEDGAPLPNEDSESQKNPGLVRAHVVAGSTYLIDCRMKGASTGDYTLKVDSKKDESSVEDRPVPLSMGVDSDGMIDDPMDRDWFTFTTGPATTRVAIRLEVGSRFNPRILMGVETIEPQSEFSVQPNKTYVLMVSSTDSRTGAYSLSVSPVISRSGMNGADLPKDSRNPSGQEERNLANAISSGAVAAVSVDSSVLAASRVTATSSSAGSSDDNADAPVEADAGDESTAVFTVSAVGNDTQALAQAAGVNGGAQAEFLLELRGMLSWIQGGALEQLLLDNSGSRMLPRPTRAGIAQALDGVFQGLSEVQRQGRLLYDLSSPELNRMWGIVPGLFAVPENPVSLADPEQASQELEALPGLPWISWTPLLVAAGAASIPFEKPRAKHSIQKVALRRNRQTGGYWPCST